MILFELVLVVGQLIGGALCVLAVEDDVQRSGAQIVLFYLRLEDGNSFSGNALVACAVSLLNWGG